MAEEFDAQGNPIRRQRNDPNALILPNFNGVGVPIMQQQMRGGQIGAGAVGAGAGGIASALAPPPADATRAPTSIPDVAPRSGPTSIMASVNPVPAGPTINNAGTTSNANGVTGFSPIMGQSTPGESGLAALGYARNADNSLRRLGTPYDQQLNLMNELQRMAQSSAPVINAQDTETRNQQQAARDAYMNNQMGNLMQHFAPGILSNQLGQGNLALQQAMQFGVGGTPGAIANAASDAANRTRENERYGPQARYDAFYNAAYNAFPAGTPHAARVRQLAQGQGGMPGLAPPEFLTGRAGGGAAGGPLMAQGGIPGAVPRPIPAANNAGANAVDTAFETGLSAFPRDAAGTPVIDRTNASAVNNAITNIMSQLGDQHLRDPEVQQRLITQFGTDALNNWLNRSNSMMNRSSLAGSNQQEQVRRFLGTGGLRQSAPAFLNPLNPDQSFWQRMFSVSPIGQGVNQAMRIF